MTTGEMLVYTKRFNEIRNSASPRLLKNERLRNLFYDLERAYERDEHAYRFALVVADEID